MIWDTNECQTLHYERLERTASNQSEATDLVGARTLGGATMRCRGRHR